MNLSTVREIEFLVYAAIGGDGRVYMEPLREAVMVWNVWHLHDYKPQLLQTGTARQLLKWAKRLPPIPSRRQQIL